MRTSPAISLLLALASTTAAGQALESGYVHERFAGPGGPGTAVVSVRGETAAGQRGSIAGVKNRLVHEPGASLDPGFTINFSALNNARDVDQPGARLFGYFGNVITPRVEGWQAVGAELNITNIYRDLGERLKAADFDPGQLGGEASRILVLKPESRFGTFDDPGYSLDAYIVAGPNNRSDRLVGAYAGLVLKSDAIAADGTGIRLGGRTEAFDDARPDAAIRVDHRWKRGLDLREADIPVSVDMAQGQRVRWDTEGGPVTLTAWKGRLFVHGPEGLKRIYP